MRPTATSSFAADQIEDMSADSACRNPLGLRLGPWCYTAAGSGVSDAWAYCRQASNLFSSSM